MTQKALIVQTGPDGPDGLEDLNLELERGWRVARVSPMGGATGSTDGPTHAALVILEHLEDDEEPSLAVEALERIERSGESVIEDVVKNRGGTMEGNGADAPLP